jgi:hypothetical protein
VAPLQAVRSGLEAVIVPDGHIYAVGGYDQLNAQGLNTVEVYGPVVSLSAEGAAPGESVTVTGSNFAANATVSVRFGGAQGQVLGSARTGATGTLPTGMTFTIPNLPAGDGTLTILDDRSRFPIRLAFRIR